MGPSQNPQWASMKSWGIFTRSKLAHALDKTFTLTLWQCLDFFDVLLCSHLLLVLDPMQAFFFPRTS
jgi:hypothetical protein